MTVHNRTGNNTTSMHAHHKPILLGLEDLGGEYAIRYSCKDSSTFYEVKDVIMSFGRDERRWDPDQMCGGKYGCWVVSEYVLDELKTFFPSLDAWMKKATGTPEPASRDIHDVPF